MPQLSLETTFLIATWVEGITYGFLFCIFCATMAVTFRGESQGRVNVMVAVSMVMFFIATFHLAMNGYRLVEGYINHAFTPGGPVAFIGNLRPWHHILKDTLYATQEILGHAAAIYRCWILWQRNWKIIALPLVLLIASIISGYTVCALYTEVDLSADVFDPRLTRWISAFYSLAVVQNVLSTGLMAYKIWSTDRDTASMTTKESRLWPVLKILVESAALQLIVEIVLLALYSSNINAQYILLESVTPLVAITFNAITIRIKWHSQTSKQSTFRSNGNTGTPSGPVQTIGSIPMRRMPIHISVAHDIELHDGKGQNSQKGDSSFSEA